MLFPAAADGRLNVRLPGFARVAAACVVAAVVTACGSVPEPHNLRLDLTGAVPMASSALQGSLQVQTFQARGLLIGRPLAYLSSEAPTELRQSATLLWEEPPALAASLLTTRALRAAGSATVVFAPDQPGIADYSLSARLERFDLVQNVTGSIAVVAIEVTAFRGPLREPFLIANYCASQPLPNDGVDGVQQAFNESFRRVAVNLIEDIGLRASGRSQPMMPVRGQRSGPC